MEAPRVLLWGRLDQPDSFPLGPLPPSTFPPLQTLIPSSPGLSEEIDLWGGEKGHIVRLLLGSKSEGKAEVLSHPEDRIPYFTTFL